MTSTIETEDVVEAVARVMCAANFARQGCEGEFGSVDDCWFAWADEARAVLAATPIERLREENARSGEALNAVHAAMLMGGDGTVGDFGWSITLLNKARPLIRAALNQQ